MARTSLTPEKVTVAGLSVTLTQPTNDGDVFDAGKVMLYVRNADDDTACTVTIPTPATVGGLAVSDAGGTVPFGGFRLFGPFPRHLFGQASGAADEGRVYVNYSTTTGITRGLIAL